MRRIYLIFLLISLASLVNGEDGYRLWLRYQPITDASKLSEYRQEITGWMVQGQSPTLSIIKKELRNGLNGLLDDNMPEEEAILRNGIVIAGTPQSSPLLNSLDEIQRLKTLHSEGYVIVSTTINGKRVTVIAADEESAVLYGVFHFLRLLQPHGEIRHLSIESSPRIKIRLLNHWDNLDGTVERGYAGSSIWDWHRLPDLIHPRYHDYARANASIGINGTVLTKTNAHPLILTSQYLKKVAALADVFRLYGIKVYLTARFNDPVELGGLETGDPLNPNVQRWWDSKANEIYEIIPDFGGFLVEAHSDLKKMRRTQGEGAAVIANALQPHGGVLIWRASIYSEEVPTDRAKQTYVDFKRTDGSFKQNVLLQVKSGPLDFQPREPFNPLFGAMPRTPLMAEFQLTQEYLGFATHLVYLAPSFKETLDSDTFTKGRGSTIARIIDGTQDSRALSGIAGVANIGSDRNWTGHTFGQANWYSFGRLAWDYQLEADDLAEEWIRMTFGNDEEVISALVPMMMNSRVIAINYMMPLGLHHIMAPGHHYGPAPWMNDQNRADKNSVYYHQADREGVGFDRTSTGSDALSQYAEPVQKIYSSTQTCPEEFLLWFHHVSWDFAMKSGNTLWQELCYRYYQGVDSVTVMQNSWASLEEKIDLERFERVKSLLSIQHKEAIWWRNACLLYFQSLSRKKIPKELEKPDKSLKSYRSLSFPYAPGNSKIMSHD